MPVYAAALNGEVVADAERIQRFIADGGAAVISRGRYTLICLAIASADTTLPTPAQADNGKICVIWSEFAHAHVISTPAGFNGKGAAGTGTFAAALGNSFTMVARNGSWWVTANIGVTIA